jgi:hypothetical protein
MGFQTHKIIEEDLLLRKIYMYAWQASWFVQVSQDSPCIFIFFLCTWQCPQASIYDRDYVSGTLLYMET